MLALYFPLAVVASASCSEWTRMYTSYFIVIKLLWYWDLTALELSFLALDKHTVGVL